MSRLSVVVAAVGLAFVFAGCSGGSTDPLDDAVGEAANEDEPIGNLTDLSDFCVGMNRISDRLIGDPPDDEATYISEEYTKLLDVVPPELAADFAAVITRLETGQLDERITVAPVIEIGDITSSEAGEAAETTVASATSTTIDSVPSGETSTTTDPAATTTLDTGPTTTGFDEEGYAPDTDPSLRLSAYVESECRGTGNNPGPPATEPLPPVVTNPDS